MFLVAANTRQALVGQKEWITTGSSGIQVQFLFSSDWDDLAKFAVFRNAEIEESVIPIALPASGLTELPAENCAAEYVDEKVYVGVYGTDGLGHIIIPTIWVSLGVLKEGAAYEGMDPPQPTQDMWAQILAIAQNAGAENAAAAEQSAEEAEASKEAIQDMNVQAETLPDESPLTVTKEVDPETGAVTLVFGLTRGPKGTKGDDGYSPTITITPIQGGHRFTVTDEDHPTGQSFDVMNGAPGAPGSPGQDGYSPAITITTITGGHRFTVTDEDHPTGQSFDVMDGTKGDQGYSPAVTITTITGGHRVTITDEDHPTGQSFDVLDGASDAGQVTFDPTQTYQSGTVGKELSDQSNAIDNIVSLGDFYNLESVTITDGQYIKSDGTIGNSQYWMVTDYIEIPNGVQSATVNRNVYVPGGEVYPQAYMVFWYDAEYGLLAEKSHTIVGDLVTSEKPVANAVYMRVNFSKNNATPFVKLNYYNSLRYIRSKTSADTPDDFTETGMYWVGSAMSGLPSENVGFLIVLSTPWSGNVMQMWVTRYNLFTRVQTSGTWRDWIESDNTNVKNDVLGIVGTYTYQFTTTQEAKNTLIGLKANTRYKIVFNAPISGRYNIYGKDNVNNLKRVYPWMSETEFTNDGTDRTLMIYNYDGTADNVDITVYMLDSVKAKALNVPNTYVVSKTANTGDYTSLSKCLIDLKDDHNPKIIEVWEGDYDLYAEYVELYNAGLLEIYTGNDPTMDYFDYCVWVPKNTHIIGKGIVRLKWMPDPATDDITAVQCRCISPLNVAATATIENVEVYCKNGRYCLHNDGLGKPEFTGAVQKYINVKFYKYANDTDPVSGLEYGFKPTTGFGIDRAMHHIYDNCLFKNEASSRAFYGHSRGTVGGITLTEEMCSDITLTNCVFESNNTASGLLCKFGNGSNSNLHIRVLFSDCYFGVGWISLQNESYTSQTTCPNAFDVTFVNCGKYKINVADPDNRYPPKSYDNLMSEVTDVKNAISQKQDAPSSAGTAGQVLGLDSNLDPVWVNQSGGGGDVSNCAPIIINTASGDVASFADGADNRQIRKIVGTIETEEGGSGWTGCVIGNSVPAPTDKAFSFLPRQSGSGDPSPTNVRPFLPYTLTLDDDSQVTILGGDVKFNGDGSADVTETWAKCTIAEIRSQAIGPSAYATGMFSTTLYYQTYKIEPSGVTNVMSDSYKQTDVAMGSMADDTIRNFIGTIYLRDTRYSNGTELVAGMGNAVIAYEIKKTQERPVYHLSNSAQLLPILAENGYALQTLPINWQTVAGTISNGTVTLNEDGSVDLINSDSGTNYHLTGIGSLMTYFGQNNVWIDTGAITECDYPADTKLYVDGLTEPDEDMIANANIASGKYFVVNNQLYLSTAAIAAGASIVPGTNCTATNLAEALNALNT